MNSDEQRLVDAVDTAPSIRTTPLSELCDASRGITYGIVKVGEYVPDGISVVRGGDIRDNRIETDSTKRVSKAVSAQFKRTILRGGEIVLNLIAEPGHSAIVPSLLAGANVTRDVAVIPVTGADTRFVNYYLQSPQCIAWLRSHLQGSVTLKINLGRLAQLPVPLPAIEDQRRIVAVLAALDDKIESNHRLTKLLEDVTDALFWQRVVKTGDDEELTLADLTAIARFVNGRAFTKHANGAGRPILRIKELKGGLSEATVYSDLEADDENVARHHDMLFAWSGSLGLYRWHGPESLINQHIFKVLSLSPYPDWFVAGWVWHHMPEFQRIAQEKATTMGHIKREHLRAAMVRIPRSDELVALDAVLGPLDQQIASLAKETLTLIRIRDALLPRLISGRLRVSDPFDAGDAAPAPVQIAAP